MAGGGSNRGGLSRSRDNEACVAVQGRVRGLRAAGTGAGHDSAVFGRSGPMSGTLSDAYAVHIWSEKTCTKKSPCLVLGNHVENAPVRARCPRRPSGRRRGPGRPCRAPAPAPAQRAPASPTMRPRAFRVQGSRTLPRGSGVSDRAVSVRFVRRVASWGAWWFWRGREIATAASNLPNDF